MVQKPSILQATLALTYLASTGLCQTGDNQVAWLRDEQDGVPAPLMVVQILNDTSRETHEAIPADDKITISVSSAIPQTAEKREPRRRPSPPKNTTQSDDDDDSGTGKTDVSMPLFMAVGLVVTAVFLQLQ